MSVFVELIMVSNNKIQLTHCWWIHGQIQFFLLYWVLNKKLPIFLYPHIRLSLNVDSICKIVVCIIKISHLDNITDFYNIIIKHIYFTVLCFINNQVLKVAETKSVLLINFFYRTTGLVNIWYITLQCLMLI